MTSSNISSRSAAAWPEVVRAALAALMLAAAAAWHAEVVFAIASAAAAAFNDARREVARLTKALLPPHRAVCGRRDASSGLPCDVGGGDDEDRMALAQHTSKGRERQKGKSVNKSSS